MPLPTYPTDAPVDGIEFSAAPFIDRFGGWGYGEKGIVAMRFLAEDGSRHTFRLRPDILAQVAFEMHGLVQFNEQSGHVDGKDVTAILNVAQIDVGGSQNETGPVTLLRIVTISGQKFLTPISSSLVAILHKLLGEELRRLPDPIPQDHKISKNIDTPGSPKTSSDTVEHFGHIYPEGILSALGLLLVRANLLEKSLLGLLQKVSDLDQQKTDALFFSTVNMKARLDMIAALNRVSTEETNKKIITDILDSVKKVTDRRNTWFHGFWAYKNDKFEVTTIQPGSNQRVTKSIVTNKEVMKLCSDYRFVSEIIDRFVGGFPLHQLPSKPIS
jgi:hypothetical protein